MIHLICVWNEDGHVRWKKGEKNYYRGNKFNDPKEYETAAQVVMRDKTHKICMKKREREKIFCHGKF